MSAPWPATEATTTTAVPALPRPAPVPSTSDVLARALAQSQRRGSRVARWRTARRWAVHHLWRHVLPTLLVLLVPSSRYLHWQSNLAAVELAQTQQTAPVPVPVPVPASPAAAEPLPPPTPAQEDVSPVLALSTQLLPVPTAAPPSFAVPPEPLVLRADSSLHSQEP
jgi:hypothetical protein